MDQCLEEDWQRDKRRLFEGVLPVAMGQLTPVRAVQATPGRGGAYSPTPIQSPSGAGQCGSFGLEGDRVASLPIGTVLGGPPASSCPRAQVSWQLQAGQEAHASLACPHAP